VVARPARRRPGPASGQGFTGTAVFTLGLALAGATVMFAFVEGVLLRPLPVREQDRLVVGWKALRVGSVPHWPLSRAEIVALGQGSRFPLRAS
jgi:hypothetical protein